MSDILADPVPHKTQSSKVSSPSRRNAGGLWAFLSILIAAAVTFPFASLGFQAFQGSAGLWPHLVTTVLPVALSDTFLLLIGVGTLSMIIGTGTAWLVTAYDFPGRRLLEWTLLLPLAMPTYIIAYAYLDLLHPIGPVQSIIRDLLGYDSPRQFRLPDIRSMWGCIMLFSFVLYPYVYITTRAMFLMQGANLLEAARTLGVSQRSLFRRVALPMARPAIAVGVALALMEALNDVGAAEFLGVRTMTVTVYTTWITRNDLPGASQIALAMLFLIVGLVALERMARNRQRYTLSAQRARIMEPRRLTPLKSFAAFCVCIIPVLVGFVAPFAFLVIEAVKRYQFSGVSDRLSAAAISTLTYSAIATVIVVTAGIVAAYALRMRPNTTGTWLYRLSTIGYAAPGTVVALAVLIPLAGFDRFIDQNARQWLGVSTGLIMMGSGAALVFAYSVRFLTIAAGSVDAGLSRIPMSLDHASRSLGTGTLGTLQKIHLPLSKSALSAAALLVFVDCVKELPATLLLRPLNVETFATQLYGEAARGTYEEAAIAALAIVAIGILPVILLARTGRRKAQ